MSDLLVCSICGSAENQKHSLLTHLEAGSLDTHSFITRDEYENTDQSRR